MELTILITTINEGENLKILLPRLQNVFKDIKSRLEILVIDGHSTDDTVEVAQKHGCRVEAQEKPGYAQAIRQGIGLARGKFLIVMDGDLSHAAEDAFQLFSRRLEADIVINSRYVKGGGTETEWYRDLLSRLLNGIYRWVLRLPFREISGGFRIYRREIFDRFEIGSVFYEVQEELLIVPHWLGYGAKEIPYTYRPRRKGASKARMLTYGWYLLLSLKRFLRLKKQILGKHEA